MINVRFFYIKKQQKNVEDHYWLGQPLSASYSLSQTKVTSELIGLAFYQMMGVMTPKTYIGEASCGPTLISQAIPSLKPYKVDLSFAGKPLEALPSSIIGLAELELASAVLGDIDVVGWLYDNVGFQEETTTHMQTVRRIIKYDAGSAIVESEQFQHFKKYFVSEQEEFPEGTMTLADNPELAHTYLKVFLKPNITKYHEHYGDVFSNLDPTMRKQALRKLFSIPPKSLQTMIHHIGEDLRLTALRQAEIISFMENRLQLFKNKFFHLIAPCHMAPTLKQPTFKQIATQKHLLRNSTYLITRFEIQPVDPKIPDFSQSAA